MDVSGYRRLIDTIEEMLYGLRLEELLFVEPSGKVQALHEGKWIPTKSGGTIRIDPANYGAGQTHAHVYGRKGDQIGVVNLDGSGSHGTKMKLHPKDAEVLRGRGFAIRPDRVVEWLLRPELSRELLLG